jgi:hypothetical protein
MKTDIESLRKFSLITAILLFSYSVAGIEFVIGERASILGLPFTISNPDILDYGLIIISVYGLVRFYYYGIMFYSTHFRTRRDLLSGLHAERARGTYT